MNNLIVGAALLIGAVFLAKRANAAELPPQDFGTAQPVPRAPLPWENNGWLNSPAAPVSWAPAAPSGGSYAPLNGTPLERFPMTPAVSPQPAIVNPIPSEPTPVFIEPPLSPEWGVPAEMTRVTHYAMPGRVMAF